MSAAIATLRNAKQHRQEAIDECQADADRHETELSACKANIRRMRDEITELDAAITALGG